MLSPFGLALLVLSGQMVACTSSASSPPAGPVVSEPATVGLVPGDEISVQVWREPDLSGTFTVDDRGIATLPLIGEREVTGFELSILRDRLLADYRQYLQNPSIEVRALRRINVLGEVRMPGLYPVDATISLSDALAVAGGITPNGNPDDIRLIRDGQVIRQGFDSSESFSLSEIRSGDQVVVGEKGWLARNPGAFLGSLIAAAAIVASAIIR